MEKIKTFEDEKFYSMSELLRFAKDGKFPFKSRTTIEKMLLKNILPGHRSKVGDKNWSWWFKGHELNEWLNQKEQ